MCFKFLDVLILLLDHPQCKKIKRKFDKINKTVKIIQFIVTQKVGSSYSNLSSAQCNAFRSVILSVLFFRYNNRNKSIMIKILNMMSH